MRRACGVRLRPAAQRGGHANEPVREQKQQYVAGQQHASGNSQKRERQRAAID
jgi:hypothetical protein